MDIYQRAPNRRAVFVNKNHVIAIARKAMIKLRKSPQDRTFYSYCARLVYITGQEVAKSTTLQRYFYFMYREGVGLTTGKSAEEIAKIEKKWNAFRYNVALSLNRKLNLPYIKEAEEQVIILMTLGNILDSIMYGKALERAKDITAEEEVDFSGIEDDISLDLFSFPQFTYLLTDNLKRIGQNPEANSDYYAYVASFIEEVEDTIINSWFGKSYLEQFKDASGGESWRVKESARITKPTVESHIASMNKRLHLIRLKLFHVVISEANMQHLKEDEAVEIADRICVEVISTLVRGVSIKDYSGDLAKHKAWLESVEFGAESSEGTEDTQANLALIEGLTDKLATLKARMTSLDAKLALFTNQTNAQKAATQQEIDAATKQLADAKA